LRILHRVRGRLEAVASEPPEVTYSLLARLHALGGPAIDDRDQHVTGQVVCPHGQQKILLDVSLLNHDHGVAVTLGVRPLPDRPPSVEDLGFDPIDVARMRAGLDAPSGLVIVSGPARAGCSTTLSCLAAMIESGDRRAIAFETQPGPPLPADTRVPLATERARATWAGIVTAQNADVVVLSDVLIGESVSEALSSAGWGRLVLASTDWTDTFSLLDHLMARPNLRQALASRLRFVVQQRMAYLDPAATATPGAMPSAAGTAPELARRRPVFEVLHISEPMRRLLRNGDPTRELRAMAETDGWKPLAVRVRAMADAGEIAAREAARLLA
jgi:Tfp pilus assembly pilus retraction ATPase PilT